MVESAVLRAGTWAIHQPGTGAETGDKPLLVIPYFGKICTLEVTLPLQEAAGDKCLLHLRFEWGDVAASANLTEDWGIAGSLRMPLWRWEIGKLCLMDERHRELTPRCLLSDKDTIK